MRDSTARSSLKTPRQDGEVVFLPDLAQMKQEIEDNARQLDGHAVVILDKSLNHWRQISRTEVVELAQNYSQSLALTPAKINTESPLVVTGHQAQFYHCGILIKYFLADFLARSFGTCPINLIVDSDLPKNISLNLPAQSENGLAQHSLNWQAVDPNLEMEQQQIPTKEQMDQWLDQLASLELSTHLRERAEIISPVVKKSYHKANDLVEFYTLINHGLARPLSLHWLELPVSRFGQTESFQAFASDLIMNCDRSHQHYNDALTGYRRENKVKNPAQPLPNLAENETAVEMPFWIFRPGKPRQPLWVRQQSDQIMLSDGQKELVTVDKSIESMRQCFKLQNISLRPRAITLTIFIRLFFADYFIHGIGGALYDQVTDRFIRTFYNCEPPAFATASATLRLPFNGDTVEDIELALQTSRHRQRDLRYNPQRFISTDHSEDVNQREALIGESNRLRQERGSPQRRGQVFREIHEVNTSMAKKNIAANQQVEQEEQRLRKQLNDAQIMADREYFFGLFDPEVLNDLLQRDNINEI
jgi:hypothetical protein